MRTKIINKKNKCGFTLIEIVVFTGIMAILMIGMVGVMLNSIRARNRSRLGDVVEFNGTWALEQIKWNLLNSTYGTVICDPANGKISMENGKNYLTTEISCTGAGIASASSELGTTVQIIGEEVAVNCDPTGAGVNLISCQNDTTGNVNMVDIHFKLTSRDGGKPEDKATNEFRSRVYLRQ